MEFDGVPIRSRGHAVEKETDEMPRGPRCLLLTRLPALQASLESYSAS